MRHEAILMEDEAACVETYLRERLTAQAHHSQVTTRTMLREETQAAWLCNELGYLLWAQDELVAARLYYERALAIRGRVLGPEHPDTARSLNNLAVLHAIAKCKKIDHMDWL
jgi:hypothetical protein